MLRNILRFLSVLLLLLGAVPAAPAQDKPAPDPSDIQIAVIPKGSTHIFWKTVHAGAAKAAGELGCQIIWKAPEREDDRNMQINVVNSFVSRRVDGIVLAPIDQVALARPAETAAARGAKVVVFDSALKSEAQTSFVATDNREGGRLGARRLGELLDGEGKVMLLRYSPGSASTHNREEGFLEVMREEFPGIELVSTNQYGGVTNDEAQNKAQNLLIRYPDVDGIFTPNLSTTEGMLGALEQRNLTDKIKFVGFDTSDKLLDRLRKGAIQGLVSQDPFGMGYLAVKTCYQAIQGEKVEPRIATPLVMVTPGNIDDEATQAVINPDLEKYLD